MPSASPFTVSLEVRPSSPALARAASPQASDTLVLAHSLSPSLLYAWPTETPLQGQESSSRRRGSEPGTGSVWAQKSKEVRPSRTADTGALRLKNMTAMGRA